MASHPPSSRLQELLAQWHAARRSGHELTPLQLCPDDPALRAELERRLAAEATTADASSAGQQTSLHAPDRQKTGPFQPTGTSPPSASGKDGPAPPGYEILSELGRGGMGVVYKARDVALQRDVALKMILAGPHAGPTELQRFQTEAEAVARFQHPNIVQVFQIGRHREMPYFVLEFCAGGSLASKIKHESMGFGISARLIETLARAMAYAHANNIIHRDLKPDNVLLAADGTPKITDFGLAKKLDSAAEITHSGSVMGTPAYMAPEQAMGDTRRVGPLSDVWALGGMLYRLLCGRPPFHGSSAYEVMAKVLEEEPTPPRQINPAIPLDLEVIIQRCMQKDPAKRYASAEALANDLQRWLNDEPILARPVGPMERSLKWIRRNRGLFAGLSAAVMALVAGTAISIWQANRASNEAKQAAEAASREREQRAIAERKTTEANQARLAAEDAQLRAEDAQREEARQRGIAQDKALAEQRANEQTKEQLARSETLVYSSRLNNALRYWLAGSRFLAQQEIQACRWDYRGWEFRAVMALMDGLMEPAFQAHDQFISAAAISPDGKQIVTTGDPKSLKVWDAATGRLRNRCDDLPEMPHLLSISPDGRLAALAYGRGLIQLRALPGGELVRDLTKLAYRPIWVGFDGMGQTLLVADQARIRQWNIATGTELSTFTGHRTTLRTVATQQRGNRIASLDQMGQLLIWDLRTRKIVQRIKADGWALDISPDGQRVAAATARGKFMIWDATTGRVVLQRELPLDNGNPQEFRSVRFTPDGEGLFVSSQAALYRYSVRTGQLESARSAIGGFQLSPSGDWAVHTAVGGQLRIFRPDRPANEVTLEGEKRNEQTVAISPDGRFIAMGEQADRFPETPHRIRVWSREDGRIVQNLGGLPRYISALAFDPTSRYLVAGDNAGRLLMWNVESGLVSRFFLFPHEHEVRHLVFSSDGQFLFSSADDDRIKMWNLKTGQVVRQFPGKKLHAGPLAVHPEMKYLAAEVDQSTITLFEIASGKVVKQIPTGTINHPTIAFNHDGSLLAVGRQDGDRSIALWEIPSGKLRLTMTGHTREITGLCFSPDGMRLFSSSWDNTVRVWETKRGLELLQLPARCDALRISSDGQRLIAASEQQKVLTWDIAGTSDDRVLYSSMGLGGRIAFSPDNQYLAFASLNGVFAVLDLETGILQPAFSGIASDSMGVAYSPDGKWLAITRRELGVQLHDARTGTRIAAFMPPLPKDARPMFFDVHFVKDGAAIAINAIIGNNERTFAWDITSGQPIESPEPLKWRVLPREVTSPNGRWHVRSPHGNNREYRITDTTRTKLPLQFSASRLARLSREDAETRLQQAVPLIQSQEWDGALFRVELALGQHPREFYKRLQQREILWKMALDADSSLHYVKLAQARQASWARNKIDRKEFLALAMRQLLERGWRIDARVVGGLLLRENKPAEAIIPLQMAIQLRGSDDLPVEEAMLAVVYKRLNDPARAAEYRNKVHAWWNREHPERSITALAGAMVVPAFRYPALLHPRYRPLDWESWHELDWFIDESLH